MLEEKPQRSQTGFLGDANHKVPYENHPYDLDNPDSIPNRRQRQRQLEDGGTATAAAVEDVGTVDARDVYKPLRIHFETQALDDTRSAENAAKIDFIKTKVLPAYVSLFAIECVSYSSVCYGISYSCVLSVHDNAIQHTILTISISPTIGVFNLHPPFSF
jgi:hypothetical protein